MGLSFPAETLRRGGGGCLCRFLRVSAPLRELACVAAPWGFGFTVRGGAIGGGEWRVFPLRRGDAEGLAL